MQLNENKVNKDFDVAAFSKDALKKVLFATHSSNTLPALGEDYDYHSVSEVFQRFMALLSSRILAMMEKLLLQQNFKINLSRLDLEEIFDVLVEANDSIMEHVGISVDQYCGLLKKNEDIVLESSAKLDVNTSWNRKYNFSDKTMKDAKMVFLNSGNNPKPQLSFKEKIDNTNALFVPIIKEKPNSLKPLAIILEMTEYGEMYSHPYKLELDRFHIDKKHLSKVEIKEPKPTEETPLHFIDTPEDVANLVLALKQVKEFAVDLEHHSYRSYLGITCLMQISTREADYLVDTLKLRDDLQPLNEVFTDPNVVKVFHGSDRDIEWLQRDLGLYVVGMFDTGQAMRVLSFNSFSLAFLLNHYCNFQAKKQYQLADWRIRPLPKEMIEYAREDTHYLLYIYDCMKNELMDKGNENNNLLRSVFERSKTLCEKRYVKPTFNDDSYKMLYHKSRKVFNTRQMHALMEIFKWRDEMARASDESTGYVLPNHMLLHIAEILPREIQGIVACCSPTPALVRQHLNALHQIILKAREISLVKPLEKDILIKVEERRRHFDLENVFHCPHDFSHLEEQDTLDSGPTIFEMWNEHKDQLEDHLLSKKHNPVTFKQKTSLTAIARPFNNELKNFTNAQVELSNVTFFQTYYSPFQRYKLVCPLLKRENEKLQQQARGSVSTEKPADPVQQVHEHFMELASTHGCGSTSDDRQHTDDVKCSEKDTNQTSELPSVVNASDDQQVISIDLKPAKKEKKAKRKLAAKDSNETAKECSKVGTLPAANEKCGNKKKLQKIEKKPNNMSEFKPYDYSKSNYKSFTVGLKIGKQGRKRYYKNQDSNQTGDRGRKRGGFRHHSSDQTTNVRKRELSWPKR